MRERPVPLDDRLQLDPARERAERAAAVAVEPRGAEGLRDRRVAVPESSEPCSASARRSTSAARAALVDRPRAPCSSAASASSSRGSLRPADLGEKASSALRRRARALAARRGVDVAGALPDRVQRALAEEPRQPRLLDVAVAAEALERLGDEARRQLADPVLRDRGGEPAEGVVALVVARARGASRSASPPRTRCRGRRARSASAAGRRGGGRTPSDARRGASPPRPRAASARSSRARSRAACGRPSR